MYFLDLCEDLAPIIRFLKYGLFPIIQWGIPIVLIALGLLDIGKAVIASKEDDMKNAQKMLVKRIVYAVLVFFVIPIVTLVFNLFRDSGASNNNEFEPSNWSDCWYAVKKDKIEY